MPARLGHWPRSPYALHLAIASGRDATLCSLDAPFVRAAQQLVLDASLIGWLQTGWQLVGNWLEWGHPQCGRL